MNPIDRAGLEASLGEPLLSVKPLASGGNSRVYRLKTPTRELAAKFYAPGAQARLKREWAALQFFKQVELGQVPLPIFSDETRLCVVSTFIDGSPVSDADEADVEVLVNWMQRLQLLSALPEAAKIGLASEAFFEPLGFQKNLAERMEKLKVVDEPSVRDFITGDLKSTLDHAIAGLPRAWVVERTLSPSDFGFHNALRLHDGSLVFLDFEHFGWDDPVKAAIDFYLHPGMNLSSGLRIQFVKNYLAGFQEDEDLPIRFRALYPVLVVKWCLILLNEFLPEHRSRREHALKAVDVMAKERQLDKAARMLSRINSGPDLYA